MTDRSLALALALYALFAVAMAWAAVGAAMSARTALDATPQDVVTRLRFALYRYGGHVPPCHGDPCDCGFKTEWDFACLPATLGDAMDLLRLKGLEQLPPFSRAQEQP